MTYDYDYRKALRTDLQVGAPNLNPANYCQSYQSYPPYVNCNPFIFPSHPNTSYQNPFISAQSTPYGNSLNLKSTSLYDIYKNSFSNTSDFSDTSSGTRTFLSKDYAADFWRKTEEVKSNSPSSTLTSLGYNAQKGQKLARIASQNTVGFTGNCARYVKNDIQQAGLGQYESGHAYQCAAILSRNPNFKEISTVGLDLKKLPAGCILVYDRGVAGYSKEYGHIEITDGNGLARSDGTTADIRAGARVFIPV